jgi:leucyl aminopeptidase
MKEILPEFHSKLLDQGLDFRILGQAIYSASRILKKKVSMAITYEKKQEEKIALRATRRAFQFKIPLEFFVTREMLALAESANPDSFYAELLLGLQEEDEKKKLEKIKAEKKKQVEEGGVRKRRRRLELADFESFDYELDLDRVAIEDIVKNTLEVIKRIAKRDKNNEAEFTKVVSKMEEKGTSDEQKRLTRARVLISCLYLFRDELITAEQELNPPYEIYISVVEGKKEGN